MRTYTIIFLFFLCLLNVRAQDTTGSTHEETNHANDIKKNDMRTNAEIESIGNRNRTYSLRLSKIKTIRYEDGRVDLLSSQNPRSIFPLGISVVSALRRKDAIMYGGGIDYFLTPNISIDLSIGREWRPFGYEEAPFLYYLLGSKYWLTKKDSKSGFAVFTGLSYGYTTMNKLSFWEIPAGISYITKFGFQSSLQLNCAYFPRFNMISPGIEFKLGWRFKIRE